MGRPPLPLGTAGKVRYISSGSNWIARCDFRDYDGKTRPVERTGATKAKAARTLSEAIRDRRTYGRDAAVSPDTRLSAIAEAWWASYVTKEGSLGSKALYRQMLDNHVIPGVGSLLGREFAVSLAERFLQKVEDSNGKSIAKTVRTVLSNVCAFAARMGAMERNPVRDTSPISVTKKTPKALSVAETKQLRAYVTYDPRAVRRGVPPLVDIMAATGERIGECLALTTDTVDIENRTVEVRGTVIRKTGMGVAIQRSPKSEAGFRTLTLSEWAMPTVELCIANAAELTVRVVKVDENTELLIPVELPTGGRRRSQPPEWLSKILKRDELRTETIGVLLPSATGTIRDPSNAVHDVKAAFEFAGLPYDSSHLIRSSVATQMDDNGVPVRVIADQMGHSRPSMTQDFYFGRKKLVTEGASALNPLGF